MIGGQYLKKRTGTEFLLLENPKDIRLAVYSIGPGLLTCLIGNQITALFLTYMKVIGFKLTSPEMNTPSSATGRILFVIAIALIPPLTEETAIRGSILQPLRRYGDGFAIFASAIIFAVLHGNLVQAPFAFIAGIGLGYICCITDSLLPVFAVHFLNNLYSVTMDFMLSDIKDERIVERNYEILTVAMIVICVILTVLFIFRLNGRKLHKTVTVLGTGGKFKALILNAPMIIAIIIMIIITAQFVDRV
jgi:membrane protease YdiL (CAAX protease family)